MKSTTNATDIIKEFESLRLIPYLCPRGIPTIGFGSTYYEDGVKVKLDDKPISKDRAEELLINTVNTFDKQVSSLISKNITLNQNQFDAIVSFAFNIGIGNFTTSTLLKKINKSDFTGASEEFKRWNKSGGVELAGLTRRRKTEKELFDKVV